MSSFFVIFCLIVHVTCAASSHEKDHGENCRYWCRTIDHRYYCCPNGKPESVTEYIWHSLLYPWLWTRAVESLPIEPFLPEIFVHKEEIKKHCPPLRVHCPRSNDWHSSPPISCHDDEDCHGWEMCCYDVCLEHKTCKPAE
ncbi:uncharacterized protein LOC143429636 [Xylocopa sonorina]|uniref:uncharacterized protein LOC143429636 n=1 Tax=Xylocopa sonorina TaxID=1818115 RepID=UPI00403AA471